VLSELRVLDLSTEVGLMCGQVLADMGADVQQWVRPRDEDRIESSFWRAYTLGKGVRVVDWEKDQPRLLEALSQADVLIECETSEFWARLGLSDELLTSRFPALIRVSISHFGREGPKAHYTATDLISVAASGHLYVSGAADAAPLRISLPQAHAHASADAAVAVLITLFERAQSGRGQLVDVSAQQSTTFPLLSRALDGAVGQPKALRSAYGALLGSVYLRNQFEARDGSVMVVQGILPPLAGFMERLMDWVAEAGFVGTEHLNHDWGQVAMGLATGEISAEVWEPVQDGIARLVASHSKQALMDEAVARRLLIAPILALDDVLESDHLSARDFLQSSSRATGRRLGPFARLSRSPLPLRENQAGAWSGPSRFEPVGVADAPPRGSSSEDPLEKLPLTGLKVLDVFWVIAGPGATRMLADYGATVVHVESSQRLDMVRNVPPYVDGVAEPERAACHHSTNANKLNVTLDLSSAEGKKVLEDLIRWADVFTESFAPGVIKRTGFGYEAVRSLNPDIIMISSSLMGQTGPWRDYAGYGNSAAAVTGFHGLTGRPGQPPTGCFGPYTDFTSVRFNALSILFAVMHRRRTGQGQYIDMSQAEAALQFLAPACLDYLESGVVAEAVGNRDARFVPHGVFPVLGDDRWIAIVIRSDMEWRRFCRLVGRGDLAELDELERRSHEDELEACIAEWTSIREGAEIEAALQDLKIPAHRVLDTIDLHNDEQLLLRQHFLDVEHKNLTGCVVESTRLRFSRTRSKRPEQAPWFGIDINRVLADLLGYGSDIIRRLTEAKVLR